MFLIEQGGKLIAADAVKAPALLTAGKGRRQLRQQAIALILTQIIVYLTKGIQIQQQQVKGLLLIEALGDVIIILTPVIQLGQRIAQQRLFVQLDASFDGVIKKEAVLARWRFPGEKLLALAFDFTLDFL